MLIRSSFAHKQPYKIVFEILFLEIKFLTDRLFNFCVFNKTQHHWPSTSCFKNFQCRCFWGGLGTITHASVCGWLMKCFIYHEKPLDYLYCCYYCQRNLCCITFPQQTSVWWNQWLKADDFAHFLPNLECYSHSTRRDCIRFNQAHTVDNTGLPSWF